MEHAIAGSGELVEHDDTEMLGIADLSSGVVAAAGISVKKETTVTDGDEDTATDSDEANITAAIKVEDDGPEVEVSNLVGTGTDNPQTGFWQGLPGRDSPGTLDVTGDGTFDLRDPQGVITQGTVTGFNASFDGTTGTGTLTADFDRDPLTPDTTVDFTLTFNNDGTYLFELVDPLEPPVIIIRAGSENAVPGGPDPVQTLSIPDEADPVTTIVFFGVDLSVTLDPNIIGAIFPGEPDLNEEALEALSAAFGTGVFDFITLDVKANVSGSGIGVNNNLLNGDSMEDVTGGDESIVANPEDLVNKIIVTIDNAQNYDPITEELYYDVYYESGSSGQMLVTAEDLTLDGEGRQTFEILEDPNNEDNLIDAVQLTMGLGTVRIEFIEFETSEVRSADDVFLDFTATLTDADGDSASTTFAVDLFGQDFDDTLDFDFTLSDAGDPNFDAFNVDLALTDATTYLIVGFDPGTVGESDQLFLLNAATAGVDSLIVDDFDVGDDAIADTQVVKDDVTIVVADAALTDADIDIII